MSDSDKVQSSACEILMDKTAKLALRFRALFVLRNLPLSEKSLSSLSHVLLNDPSVLLKHEVAFCLGQMKDQKANQILRDVLSNETEDAMVRHEAGEALAAIGSPESLDILAKYSSDPTIEVAQTCQLGVCKIQSQSNQPQADSSKCQFMSIDPAPAAETSDITVLGSILCDPDKSLFERYQAMFALRNLNSKESVEELGKSLLAYQEDETSSLLKHEIAYIFGQMQNESSLPYLVSILEDKTQHYMVRHEAAEAIGSIGTDEAQKVLEKFSNDPALVVKQSVDVALDMNEYERDNNQFLFLDVDSPSISLKQPEANSQIQVTDV